jgi:glutamine synthetase
MMTNLIELYGENVFSMKLMRKCLSEATYKSLVATIKTGKILDAGIADEVAEAMKGWAVSKGATHYTHWFQPLIDRGKTRFFHCARRRRVRSLQIFRC